MKLNSLLAGIIMVCMLVSGLLLSGPAEAQDFRLTYPDGGEKLSAGSKRFITWQGYEHVEVDIYLSVDSGANYNIFIGKASGGSLLWTVPDIATNQARIKITGVVEYLTRPPLIIEDTSSANFSIGRPPEPPVDLSATAVSGSEIQLSWVDTADNETGFSIERDQQEVFTVGPNVQTAIHSDLPADTTCSYRVRAFNAFGYSKYSNTVEVSTLSDAVPDVTVIKLGIGSKEYYVNGEMETMDTSPIIHEGRTLLPIRYVAGPLGGAVGWDASEQKATVTLEHTFVEMWIGRNLARVNGVEQPIDNENSEVAPIIVPPGRTMLPLRFVVEALGCEIQWDAPTREVTVEYDPQQVEVPPQLLVDCSDHVIDFEDVDAGTEIFNYYGDMGISFPLVPGIIEPAVPTSSGTKALSVHTTTQEFGGKLVIEFTTGQTCVSMYVGLMEDTHGNKVTATLKAFDAGTLIIIPGYGMEMSPVEEVAVFQCLIGPGPADVSRKMMVRTDEPEIYRVELSFGGGYTPIIDDLRFATIGEPFADIESCPKAVIEVPSDDMAISGFGPHGGEFDLMGTVHEQFKLKDVTVTARHGDEVRSGKLSFSGEPPVYTFGGPNIHGLLSPGENRITVTPESFSSHWKKCGDSVTVYYQPLEPGVEAELLILTADEFYGALVPLRDWKNSSGISTHIMSLSSIEQDYRFAGSRDLPEQVKRAIAHAYVHHSTRYVMLVGDGDRFPVRYHRAGREGVSWGVVYPITDLYYACLFGPEGQFDTWDGNNNGVIGEWWAPLIEGQSASSFDQINIDNCSLKPDVAVGRVPASTVQEVADYVAKVIKYETTVLPYDEIVLWNGCCDFRNDDEQLDYVAEELLSEFTAKKHYRPPGYEDLAGAEKNSQQEEWRQQLFADISRGPRFAIYFGHGSRRSMYPLVATDVEGLGNYGKYPVFIASACDTAKFVQEWDRYMDVDGGFPPCWPSCQQEGWPDPRPEPAPIQPASIDVNSMAEVLLFAPYSGGIGFLGAHSGTNNASHPFVVLFINAWNHQQGDRLGGMWMIAVREFVEQYLETDHPFSRCDFMSHHIHKFVLFGDPSLRVKD